VGKCGAGAGPLSSGRAPAAGAALALGRALASRVERVTAPGAASLGGVAPLLAAALAAAVLLARRTMAVEPMRALREG
jgi:hypothetical protein